MSLPSPIKSLPDRAGELRDLLVRWCNQNSGSTNLRGLATMLALLRHEFSRFSGATVETVPLEGTTAQALRVRCRPAAPLQVLLSGHFDTVYAADHPFQKCEQPEPGLLRGPGVADMKGGLVVMLAALQAFEETAHTAKLGWEIILTPDEETGSTASALLLTESAPRHALALIFEPARANGDLVKSRKGTGIFTLTCHGRAAHAGRDPSAGRNAILAICELLPQADALADELPGVMVNVGSIRGGGTVNIVPDLACADINVRVTRAGDDAAFLRRLDEIIAPFNARDGYTIEVSGQFNRPPKQETPFEEALFLEWKKCGWELGASFDWQHVGGGSDGNLLSAAGLPNLDGLGVRGDGLHSSSEVCHLDSLVGRAQIAALFLHRLAVGQIELPPRQPQPDHVYPASDPGR